MWTIKQLFDGVEILRQSADALAEVEGLCYDTRKLKANDVFFALEGRDGGDKYVYEAVHKGAKVIVSGFWYDGVPCIQVENVRMTLGKVCFNAYLKSKRVPALLGIVGTNGKTTCSYILSSILNAAGHKTAVIGTLGVKMGEEKFDSNMTTPDTVELFKYLGMLSDKKVEYVAIEVSAHAIYYKKLYPLIPKIAIFTNCTQDHLDFFKSMENYSKTKESFFTDKHTELGIINVDDPLGLKMINSRTFPNISYGLYQPSDAFAINISYNGGYTSFVANICDEVYEVKVPLLGEFNVYNALACMTAATALGINKFDIIDGLKELGEIEGRFNIINSDITVIIDYAHTPDGLINILTAVNKLPHKEIISVFGCGGNRDTDKRPKMGEISAKLSNLSIITSDNPRYEVPEAIIEEIVVGVKKVNNRYIKITDRKDAIDFAVRIASPGDIVLIAGKGGENYIDEKGVKTPFSDRDTAKLAIRRYREKCIKH